MRRLLVLLIVACGALAIIASCKEPTQIVIEAYTNVEYKPGIVTAFTVGSPGQTEKADPTTETAAPWNGSLIGTLVVVPGTSDDASLSVKLVLGVVRGARECVAPKYEGCIVARRRLRYVPNERLRLPITLYAACQDVPCDELSTCSVLGKCVPIEPECNGATCALPGELDGDGQVIVPPNDAGGTDGADANVPSEGGIADGAADAIADAVADAVSDAKDGAAPDAGDPNSVFCNDMVSPDNRCAAPKRCCAPAAGSPATCISDTMGCPTTHAVVSCDGPEDCGGEYCCLTEGPGSVTLCSAIPCQVTTNEMCESTGTCKGGGACTGTAYGYKVCQ